MDFNPKTQGKVHPEQGDREMFLGNFDPTFAKERIIWKTKRIGITAYENNGLPYPETIHPDYRPVPVFAERNEILKAHLSSLYEDKRVNREKEAQ